LPDRDAFPSTIVGDLFGFDPGCQFFLTIEGGDRVAEQTVRAAASSCSATDEPFSLRVVSSRVTDVVWESAAAEQCLLDALSGVSLPCWDTRFVCDSTREDLWPQPILRCVEQRGPQDYIGRFTYESTQSAELPLGEFNHFSPGVVGRGQPTVFRIAPRDFGVRFDGNPLTWTLAGRSVTASAESSPCSAADCGDVCGKGDESQGAQCVDGACIGVCGDGWCGLSEGYTCPADCACDAGSVCLEGGCAGQTRCGVDWQCGYGLGFGYNALDCGPCGDGLTCTAHACR
jgi:hypothetical protein